MSEIEIAVDILRRARRIRDLLDRIDNGERLALFCHHPAWVAYQVALIRQVAARYRQQASQ
jgi:hypothetical protein